MVVYQELASGVALFALNCNKSWWWWWFFLPIIISPLVELLWPSLWQYSNIFEYSTTHYILEAHLKHTWSILGAYLKHTWTILEAYLKHTWSKLEANLKHTWSILEAYLKHIKQGHKQTNEQMKEQREGCPNWAAVAAKK
jgi:hypothetical protein